MKALGFVLDHAIPAAEAAETATPASKATDVAKVVGRVVKPDAGVVAAKFSVKGMPVLAAALTPPSALKNGNIASGSTYFLALTDNSGQQHIFTVNPDGKTVEGGFPLFTTRNISKYTPGFKSFVFANGRGGASGGSAVASANGGLLFADVPGNVGAKMQAKLASVVEKGLTSWAKKTMNKAIDKQENALDINIKPGRKPGGAIAKGIIEFFAKKPIERAMVDPIAKEIGAAGRAAVMGTTLLVGPAYRKDVKFHSDGTVTAAEKTVPLKDVVKNLYDKVF